ncbi:MAG: hypothetical protein B7733_02085 [Myxococcales bacterium FL481]|nr:MAG: hypothetical protein B7733_02085 [Myxococcales bacterium FL481]
MFDRRRHFRFVPLGLMLCFCGQSDGTEPPSSGSARVIPREDVTRLAVKAEVASGELRIAAGECDLAEVSVSKSGVNARPQVHFDRDNGAGRLVLVEKGRARRAASSSWDVCLSRAVPTALAVSVGAGESVLDVGELDLRILDVSVGAGQIDLDLSGLQRPLQADIQGGVGSISIDTPPTLGVRVDADRGIGSLDVSGLRETDDGWVNDAYRDDATALVLDINVGIGSIEVGVGDPQPASPSLSPSADTEVTTDIVLPTAASEWGAADPAPPADAAQTSDHDPSSPGGEGGSAAADPPHGVE